MEEREDTRERKLLSTHGQGTCPGVCPAGAADKEGMRAAWRMKGKLPRTRMMATTVATRAIRGTEDTTYTADRAKWEEDLKREGGGTTDTDTDTGPGPG